MPQLKPDFQTFVKIKVIGVGGAGGNAITRMQTGQRIRGVEFLAINTDTQDLHHTLARKKLHIGRHLTYGLGTGMNPELGRQAAEEAKDEIARSLKGSEMVFITAGMGGGTGTGASPVVAQIAKDLGCLTLAVVTKPFVFEGLQRERIAQEGILNLKEIVDSLIVIKNDKIFSLIDKDTPLLEAFEKIDAILKSSIEGVSDLITLPGIINVDFADVKTIIENAGSSLIGIGYGQGENRAVQAAQMAIESPLLETSIQGATGLLLNIGGNNLRMEEIKEVAEMVRERADSEARIIFGAFEDRRLKKDQIKVTILATGFNPYLAKSERLPSKNLSIFEQIRQEKEKKEDSSQKQEQGKEKNESPFSQKKEFSQEKEEKKEEGTFKDYFDIPAFFRRKKKNK